MYMITAFVLWLVLNHCFLLFFCFRAFCVGGKDMNTRIFGAERFANLIIYSVGGHNGPIVGAFFEHNSLDVSLLHEDKTLSLTAPLFYTTYWTHQNSLVWAIGEIVKILFSILLISSMAAKNHISYCLAYVLYSLENHGMMTKFI